jgi:7-cyano-7-deazaguanine reductase
MLQVMPDPKILETFPNPEPGRDYLIEHTHHEFTSLCPITGHPDFATLTVRYVANRLCVELKSLKLYFHAYRNEGIFFEAVTNRICDDLGALLRPRRLTVVSDWRARGGFTSVITAEWRPQNRRRRR